MTEHSSYRQILRSSSIIGGASVINILIGLVRTKVVAMVLGPAGVGLIGLLQSLMATAATVSALGLGTVGTRQISEAAGRGDLQAISAARRALFWGTLLLATLGGLLFWGMRLILATSVMNDPALAGVVGWLGLGVALTVITGTQGALLRGLRKIGDIARISVYAALLSSALGVSALLAWGEQGLLIFVLSAPFASFVLGHWYVAKLPRVEHPTTLRAMAGQWKTLARLGAAFMVTGVVVTVGHLMVRTLVQRQLGADALGYFQASWAIAMTYIGFVLGAMGTDFYPRLAAVIHDHEATNRLVNEQSEVALLLAGPIFLAMLGLAPWVIELLYSSAFGDAVVVLRWQVLGDVLKIVSWPLGIIILAAGDSRTYMLTESLAITAFVGLTWIGLPLLGIEATGVAFLAMYVLYLPLVYWLAWRRTGFLWERGVFVQFVFLLLLALVVFSAAAWSKWLGAGLGVTAALGLGMHALARLGHMANLGGPLGRVATNSRKLMMKIGIWHE